MKTALPEFYFDDNLQEVCKDPATLRIYIQELKDTLETATEPKRKVSLMGELGVRLRILRDVDEAEEYLRKALQVAKDAKLGTAWEVQQQLRLAHVFQWQQDFANSDRLFAETLEQCRHDKNARGFLGLALQHAGKNFFDQHKYREALTLFNEALKVREKEQAPEDQIESTKLAIARTRQLLARQV